jgi:hypothetical protein
MWTDVNNKVFIPPYVPKQHLKNEYDLSNFDAYFLDMSPTTKFTPQYEKVPFCGVPTLKWKEDITRHFQGFSFHEPISPNNFLNVTVLEDQSDKNDVPKLLKEPDDQRHTNPSVAPVPIKTISGTEHFRMSRLTFGSQSYLSHIDFEMPLSDEHPLAGRDNRIIGPTTSVDLRGKGSICDSYLQDFQKDIEFKSRTSGTYKLFRN